MLSALSALVIATPLFGLHVVAAPPRRLMLDLQSTIERPIAADPISPPELLAPETAARFARERELDSLGEALRARRSMSEVHEGFAIASWAAMAITAVLGGIQLYDEYGFTAPYNDTPCVRGDAVFGFCGRTIPWPHAIAAGTTAALFATAFALGYAIPDPLDIASSSSPEGERLRAHRALGWIALVGVAAQAILGAIIANADLDYRTSQSLAWVHMGVGLSTFGVMTANALLEF